MLAMTQASTNVRRSGEYRKFVEAGIARRDRDLERILAMRENWGQPLKY